MRFTGTIKHGNEEVLLTFSPIKIDRITIFRVTGDDGLDFHMYLTERGWAMISFKVGRWINELVPEMSQMIFNNYKELL